MAWLICRLPAQTQIDLRTQAKRVDFSNASSTKPSKAGTTLPAQCSAGETFVKTDAAPGANLFVCTGTDVWSVQNGALPSVGTDSAGKILTNDATDLHWRGAGGDVSGEIDALTVNKLQGRPLAPLAPTSGDFLSWDGTQWRPKAGATVSGIQSNQPWLCNSTTGTTSYTCSLAAAAPLTSYSAGMWLTLLADTTNNGAATLNVDGAGLRKIRQSDGVSDPVAAQITSGRAVTITYDGTCWRLPPYSGVPLSAAANQFVTGINAAGVATTMQPSFGNLAGSLASSQMPALSGDVAAAAGTVTTSLATVNATPGICGDSTHVCQVTTNAKGLVTQQTAIPVSGTGGIGSLNGLSASSQSFTNDANVTITSTGINHALGWSGLLALNRGGLNANLSGTGGAHQVLRQAAPGSAITVGQLNASDIAGLAASATTDATNASNISSGTLAIARIPTGVTSSSVALGNHSHSGYETTANKGVNGGYIGLDSSGNVAVPGSITAAKLLSTDTTHTGGLTLSPGTAANFADPIPSGTFRLYLNAANGNRLTRRDSSGVEVAVEGGSLTDLLSDTTPQLGGDLDLNGHNLQTVTPAELGYLHGVTGGIQPQFDSKQALSGKDQNGGYVGRDSSGNIAIPSAVMAGSFVSSDTSHTGKIELTPGTSGSFANNIQSGNFGLYLNSADGNKLYRRSSAGVDTLIEGGATSVLVNGISVPSPNFNASTPPAEASSVNAKFQVSSASVSAEVPTGTTNGTVAAGNDSRFVPTGKMAMATDTPVTLAQLPADFVCSAATASSTDYACGFTGPPGSLVVGERYRFRADVANTGASGKPTITFNSLPTVQIVKVQGGVATALAAGDIRAGQYVDLVYDGTNMQMISQLGNAGSGAMVYPGAGLPNSTGSGWGPSYAVGGVNGLVQLNGSGYLPALNGSLLTNLPAATALSGQYIDWNAATGPTSIANKPTIPTIGSGMLKGSGGNAVAATEGTDYIGASNTRLVASGKTPMATDTAVLAAQMPAFTGAVTTSAGSVATTLAVAYRTDTWSFNLGTDNASADLVAADIGPQGRIAMIPTACTVSEITVAANAGTPSVIVRKNHAGTQTNLLSGTLATGTAGGIACATTGAACADGTTKSGTVTIVTTSSTNVLAAGDWLETTSGVASSGAKRLSVAVTCVRN